MKKVFLLLVAFTAILSCSKKSESNLTEQQKLDAEMQKIGALHNEYVINSYNAVLKLKQQRSQYTRENNDPTQLKEDIFNYFKSITFDPSVINLTSQQFWTNAEGLIDVLGQHEYNYELLPSKSGSAVCIPYFESINRIIEENSTIADINSQLDILKTDVESNLTGNDLVAVLGTISIAKSSTYLWFPEELGGYDLLTKTFGRPDNSQAKMSWWKRAIVGDASASAQYFLGIGVGGAISAAFVPGTNAVLFGGWAITAGIGSACGALGL